MIPRYRIFYSWQSDNKESKKALRKALNAVIKQLKGEGISIDLEEGGSRDNFMSIEDAVRMKIQKCDIFVGDVTPIGNVSLKSKLLPNANVMYEMGIATESMTANRIIAAAMVGDWKLEDMPFDFNHYSMLLFEGSNDIKDLTVKIRERIRETDKIERRNNCRFFSERLVGRNERSGKYLPDTFLENREAKDMARLFAAPYKMYGFLFDKLSRMSFQIYNRKRKRYGAKDEFKLDISQWDVRDKAVDLDKLHDSADGLLGYLRPNVQEMDKNRKHGWEASYKTRMLASEVEMLNKKIMVVTSEAGQGKTNFVCDLINNLFIPDGIPFIFVNAYELEADYLARSIAQEYNFIGSGSLEDAILKAERFCQRNLQHLIIVIDGLNENVHQRLLQNNLIRVLGSIVNHRHVKVIMTCRKTFFEQNYGSLKVSLGDDMVELSLDRRGGGEDRLERNEISCLIERYSSHFNTVGKLHPAVTQELIGNLLLLRIFFETNEGSEISQLDYIERVGLYENYYNQLCEKIQQVIEQDSSATNTKNVAHLIFQHVLGKMIEMNTFRNIPYSEIFNSLPLNEAQCFESFLNANLIIRHDPIGIKDGDGDVINFTFEEIRDFLIVKYLAEIIYSNDTNEFWTYIDKFAESQNNLAEGIKRFLFLYARNKGRDDIIENLKTKEWYEDTFNYYVWDVKEDMLTDDDVNLVKKLMLTNSRDTVRYLTYYHWSPNKHPKLNLNALFEVIDELETVKQKEVFENAWKSKNGHSDVWGGPEITERSEMLRDIEKGIRKRKDDTDTSEKDILEKLKSYLKKTADDKMYVMPLGKERVRGPLAISGYDFYRYLMTVHKGTKKQFLEKAGAKKGFAKNMFGEIYDAIFEESLDVEEIYRKYFQNEYKDLAHFISMRYCIPIDGVKQYVDAIESGEYRVIDFSSLEYGSNAFENLFSSDEMFERMYNWLNWKDDESKN